MKLSIIIALYNTEKYIEKCIRSIYNKSTLKLRDFEVIVINDGSTDKSQTIVENLMREFPNIQLINKENGGQSSARNIGFDLAKGDYFFCLDSDDSIEANRLEEMLNYCSEFDLDILSFNFIRISESNLLLPRGKENYKTIESVLTGGEFLNKFSISGSMWRYFYRTALIKKNKLSLIEGIFHEDEEFVIQVLSYAKRVKYVAIPFYNYLTREDSTVNNKALEHRVKLLNDIITVAESLNIRLLDLNEGEATFKGVAKKKEQLMVSVFLRMKKEKIPKSETKIIIESLKNKGLYPVKIRYSNYKFKMASVLLNNSTFINTVFNKFN